MLVYATLFIFVVLLFVPPFLEEMKLRKLALRLRQMDEQKQECEASTLLNDTQPTAPMPRTEAGFDPSFVRRETLLH
jgi:hypothetical protein